ncbi:MAG: small, acid-soluble spore protein, alpha/beta type [Firmicutes bacterium HGW-Firmicutes-15]|nr:MAG: small, acid-soluble spore protein, alpha/beta type [Firmicutes bacterium HGW-Firmicutes-15]
MTERDRLKMEIAKELGIWEQVESDGWESLTNAACGRVGGIMRKRLQEQRLKQEKEEAQQG